MEDAIQWLLVTLFTLSLNSNKVLWVTLANMLLFANFLLGESTVANIANAANVLWQISLWFTAVLLSSKTATVSFISIISLAAGMKQLSHTVMSKNATDKILKWILLRHFMPWYTWRKCLCNQVKMSEVDKMSYIKLNYRFSGFELRGPQKYTK